MWYSSLKEIKLHVDACQCQSVQCRGKHFPISQRLTSHGAAVSVGNLFLARVSGDWREGDALVKMLYQHPVTCDQGQRLSRRPSPFDLTHLVMLIDTAGSVIVLCRETCAVVDGVCLIVISDPRSCLRKDRSRKEAVRAAITASQRHVVSDGQREDGPTTTY